MAAESNFSIWYIGYEASPVKVGGCISSWAGGRLGRRHFRNWSRDVGTADLADARSSIWSLMARTDIQIGR